MVRDAALWLMLTLAALAQAGCALLTRPDDQPYSPRTAGAYEPVQPRYDKLARSYLASLKKIVSTGQEPYQPRTTPVAYAPVDLTGLPSPGPGPQYWPFGRPETVAPPDQQADQQADQKSPANGQTSANGGEKEGQTKPAKPTPKPPAVQNQEDRIAQLEAFTSLRPRDLNAQLRLRLEYLANRMDDKALTPIAIADDQFNNRMLAILGAMAEIRDGRSDKVDTSDPAAALLAQKTLRERLLALAELKITLVELCKAVEAFGVYEKIDAPFLAGRSHPLIVYCQLNNCAIEIDLTGTNKAKVGITLSVYDSAGKLAQKPVERPDELLTADRVDRFFAMPILILSDALPAGEYTLKITVQDTVANRVASATKPIEIVGQ